MCLELEATSEDNCGYSTRSKNSSVEKKKRKATFNEKMPLTDSDDTFPFKDESISNDFFDHVTKPKLSLKKGISGKGLKVKNGLTSTSVKGSIEGTENRTCPICQKVFPDNHSFTLHIREHNASNNNQSHVCKLCSKKLSSASSLDRHSYVHSGEKPFSCTICKTTFTTNGNMHRHMRIHKEDEEEVANPTKKVCRRNVETEKEEDEEMTNNRNRVRKINVEIKSDTYCCLVCSKRFISKESLQSHMSTHQNVLIECRTCFEKYIAQTNHVCKLRINEVKMDKTDSVVGFKDLNSIFECCDYNKSLPSELIFRTHEHDFCSDSECPISSKCIHKLMHETTEDTIESDKDNFLATLDLKKVTNSPTASESSTSQNLSEYETLQDNPSDGSTKIEEEDKMDMHTNQIESSNDFADISTIIAHTSNATLLNMRASPAVEDTIILENATQYNTESPINEKSSSNVAEGSSGDSSNRDSDENNDGPNRKRHKCKYCSLSFENMRALRGHARCHSQNGPHRCDICPYTSVDKSTLSRHMRTHNGERPFKCNLCDYAFTTKANSHRHVKKKHKIPDDQVALVVVYNPNMLDSGSLQTASNCKGETVCKYCGKDFTHTRLLKHHLRSINNSCNLKPFTCRRCHLGFSTKNNCIRHIGAKHPDFKEKVKELIITRQELASNQSNQPNPSYSTNNEATTEEDEPSDLRIVDNESDNFQGQSNQAIMEEKINGHEEHIEVNESDQENEQNQEQESSPEKLTSGGESNLSDTDSVYDAAFSLIDLSEGNRFQAEPLDLSLRAIDLSSKSVDINQEISNEIHSKQNLSNSLTLKNEDFVEPPPAHNTPVMTTPLCMEHPLSNFILPINSIQDNSNQFMIRQMSPVAALPLIHVSQNASPSSPSPLNNTPSNSAVCLMSNDEANSQNSCMLQMKMVKKKLVSNAEYHNCEYCDKKFTLKSNRERHVKKQHPEFARPSRSRNFIPSLQEEVLKPLQNVSDTTKNRLRSILTPKFNSCIGTGKEDAECTLDLRDESVLALSNENMKVEKRRDLMDQNSKIDLENSDLASVTSLIHTANSQVIKKYLADANAFHSSPENISSSESEMEDSKSKNSILTCEYCDLSFRWVSALHRHLRTHTGTKPYHCPSCPVTFSTKSNRDRHLKKQCCGKSTRRFPETSEELHNGQSSKWRSLDSKNEVQPQCNIENKFNSYETLSNNMNGSCVVEEQQNDSLPDIPKNCAVIRGGTTLRTIAHIASLRFQSLDIVQQELECKFCQNTYKNNDDLTNHMKELHPLEYKMLIGESVDTSSESIIPWKKRQ